MHKRRWFSLLLMLALLLGAFGGMKAAASPAFPRPGRRAASMLDARFRAEEAEGGDGAWIDTSSVSEGYVAVSAKSDKRLKFQVVTETLTYNYDLKNNGDPAIFPLQSGSGSYRFRIMENTVDKKYAEKFAVDCEVKLADEFQPFLRPNEYVKYSSSSDCVKKSAELAAGAGSEQELVAAVYDFICATVKYDREKAASVKSGYLPSVDETMKTGKGICFDYASLAAAMLRSQGVPTKMIFGYVAPNDLYHAWNMFYTEETGWVSVKFQVDPDNWNRIDLTFSANGADSKFIGDGSNYSDLYEY